jgi:predicted phage-related endonuclease
MAQFEGEALGHWLAARCGCLTASRMADVLAVSKAKGKEGTPLKARFDYMREILAERMTGEAVMHYVNDAMQFGSDNEAAAIAAWEASTGEFVKPATFYRHPRIEFFGATPDGLIGDDGLIEAKVPTSSTFVGWRMAGVVPEEHHAQMLAQLACTGRKWVQFVAYEPRAHNPRLRLFVKRFEPEPNLILWVEAQAELFLKEVDLQWELLTAGGDEAS